ncbi:MAG: fumarate hydratase, partial [Candidatus Cloacimonetes bacterium]|nr:fumarate hydratase [Candidatus Cloacimonadota bacterium]
MKEIDISKIIPVVKKLCMDANYYIDEDVIKKIKEFQKKEESPTAQEILSIMLENYKLAADEKMP